MERADFAIFKVDLPRYSNVVRGVKRVFPRPSQELLALVINFCHHDRLAVARSQRYYLHTGTSHRRALRSLDFLVTNDYVQQLVISTRGQTGIYSRTPLFEETFRFRKLPPRVLVLPSALRRESLGPAAPDSVDIASIPALQTYCRLVQPVKLSLANGSQVFEDIVLRRVGGARLYQMGIHGYQTIPKEERKQHLLIDGRRTVELDYVSLHPSILFNIGGKESPNTDIYFRLLREVGLPQTAKLRSAMKVVFLIAINIDGVRGFCSYVGRDCEEYRQHLRSRVRPKEIYSAIVALYPELKPYVCTGKQGFLLQRKDSEIMVDVLETLARMGIVALPEHDSVICHPEHVDTVKGVMQQVYQQHMGFDIRVK